MKATQPIIELFYVDTRQIYWSPLFASSMVVMMGDIIWNLLFTLNGFFLSQPIMDMVLNCRTIAWMVMSEILSLYARRRASRQ
jgi:hypothetical protein